MIELGVNIDHVATVRQARRTFEPDPVIAAALAEQGGADGITFHLREDRRHIQERDVEVLMQTVTVKTNLEIACDEATVKIACKAKPTWALLVPEGRDEVTTEGGLDLTTDNGRIARAIDQLREQGILVSLFLDPDVAQVEAAAALGVDAVELHTGPYANAGHKTREVELQRLAKSSELAVQAGMRFHAGHGLNYVNVRPVAALPDVIELNIGHSIVSRAVMVGMREAVAEMRRLLDLVRPF
ncbi:Pyridoxine 5'-phosphate synthase [Roseimaritima multifibrata]|uniref:Pyridoxine 5'-phosphate synthase n=1 Tax=Roseimaritima multifibrata TaxID=1930274 RepID=A0A517MAW2_9BACT|nr:pyridoxine 5'-phosphate synthase [Roseimaritima multifibrata]QDS92016.1 Pyridoxine 5'-phosphate synthase [Roseimaritima multifibrata]